MKLSLKILSAFLISLICFVMAFIGRETLGEGYNPLVPDIDTRFTEQFNKAKFNSIKIGTDTNEVIRLIGRPFFIQHLSDTSNLWYYSDDGKCKWMDFAWLGMELEVKNERVISVNKPIHYD